MTKENLYYKMYYATAVLHLIFAALFAMDKCQFLVLLNVLFSICYVILGYQAKRAISYMEIFRCCGAIMLAHILIHLLLLGPNFGFQYLFIGSIPVLFFISYTGEQSLKHSIIISGTLLVLFLLAMSIGHIIPYPLFQIRPVVQIVMMMINIIVSFFFAVCIMTFFVVQASSDTGTLKTLNSDLEITANVDALTGFHNRRSIETYINKAFAKATGEGQDFTLLMCDLDDFKKVNDTYGHDCGDQVLKNVASILQNEVRPEDLIFRFGGEEILIIISGGKYVAGKVAERCRASVEAGEVQYKDTTVKVTMTIGGATYYQGASRNDLLERADANLYEGKRNGKNQVVL